MEPMESELLKYQPNGTVWDRNHEGLDNIPLNAEVQKCQDWKCWGVSGLANHLDSTTVLVEINLGGYNYHILRTEYQDSSYTKPLIFSQIVSVICIRPYFAPKGYVAYANEDNELSAVLKVGE